MCCSQQSATVWQLADIIYLPPGQLPTRRSVSLPSQRLPSCVPGSSGLPQLFARPSVLLLESFGVGKIWRSIWFSTRNTTQQRGALLVWMCKRRQSASATKHIRYGFKALQVMCCLLTFILCSYHSLSLGENDNALGFKALRQAQHLRVLTFLVLIGWICVLRVTTEIGITTLETKTSLTGKSLKRLLPGMHITPGNWFCPPSF